MQKNKHGGKADDDCSQLFCDYLAIALAFAPKLFAVGTTTCGNAAAASTLLLAALFGSGGTCARAAASLLSTPVAGGAGGSGGEREPLRHDGVLVPVVLRIRARLVRGRSRSILLGRSCRAAGRSSR